MTCGRQQSKKITANGQRRRNRRAVGYDRERRRASHLIACIHSCRNAQLNVSALSKVSTRIWYDVIGLSQRGRDPCSWYDGALAFLGGRQAGTTLGRVGCIVAHRFLKNVASVAFYNQGIVVLTQLWPMIVIFQS